MAFLGWRCIRHWFAPLLPPAQIVSYIAGLILLVAVPCTAMFVWSRLTGEDPLFTLSQVAPNDGNHGDCFCSVSRVLARAKSASLIMFKTSSAGWSAHAEEADQTECEPGHNLFVSSDFWCTTICTVDRNVGICRPNLRKSGLEVVPHYQTLLGKV